jgi:hypothetical protein
MCLLLQHCCCGDEQRVHLSTHRSRPSPLCDGEFRLAWLFMRRPGLLVDTKSCCTLGCLTAADLSPKKCQLDNVLDAGEKQLHVRPCELRMFFSPQSIGSIKGRPKVPVTRYLSFQRQHLTHLLLQQHLCSRWEPYSCFTVHCGVAASSFFVDTLGTAVPISVTAAKLCAVSSVKHISFGFGH